MHSKHERACCSRGSPSPRVLNGGGRHTQARIADGGPDGAERDTADAPRQPPAPTQGSPQALAQGRLRAAAHLARHGPPAHDACRPPVVALHLGPHDAPGAELRARRGRRRALALRLVALHVLILCARTGVSMLCATWQLTIGAAPGLLCSPSAALEGLKVPASVSVRGQGTGRAQSDAPGPPGASSCQHKHPGCMPEKAARGGLPAHRGRPAHQGVLLVGKVAHAHAQQRLGGLAQPAPDAPAPAPRPLPRRARRRCAAAPAAPPVAQAAAAARAARASGGRHAGAADAALRAGCAPGRAAARAARPCGRRRRRSRAAGLVAAQRAAAGAAIGLDAAALAAASAAARARSGGGGGGRRRGCRRRRRAAGGGALRARRAARRGARSRAARGAAAAGLVVAVLALLLAQLLTQLLRARLAHAGAQGAGVGPAGARRPVSVPPWRGQGDPGLPSSLCQHVTNRTWQRL